MKKEKLGCLWLILLLLMILIVLVFAKCSTEKSIKKSATVIDSTYIHNLEQKVKTHEATITTLEQQVKESSYSSVDIDTTPCPPQVINIDRKNCQEDSLLKIILDQAAVINNMKTKIRITADGATEIEGRAVRIQQSKESITKIALALKREKDSLASKNDSLTVQLAKKVVAKEKEKETKFFTGWWLIIVGLIGGWCLKSKIGSIRLTKTITI